MRRVLGSLLLLGTSVQAVAAFDPPDLNLEYQLHRQFLKQNQPANAKVSGASENYKIQTGETLWSLSEMLYGDGNYWPRVWAQSRKPHLVRPGHHLQFLMGSEDETPAFRFSEDFEPGSNGLERTAGSGQNPIVDIPPPEVPPKPVLKVPKSFPEWQSVFKPRQIKTIDYSNLDFKRMGIANRYYLRSWVQEYPIVSMGKYQEGDSEAGLPIQNQYVYVKIKRGQAQAGQKFLIVRDAGQIKRMHKQWNGKDKMHLVQVAAEVELAETVTSNYRRSKDNDEYQTYRALITQATGLSIKGSDIISGSLKVIDTDPTSNYGSINAQIVGSEKSEASAVFGPGDLVFLNKGSNQGVEEGQMLEVYTDRSIRDFNAEVPISPASSGLIKVVHISSNVATAIVINARDSIQQGDQVRQASTASAEKLDYVNPSGPSAAEDELAPGGEEPSNLEDENLEEEIESENF